MAKASEVVVGAVFGHLTVVGEGQRSSLTAKGVRNYPTAICMCSCGSTVTVQPVQLKPHSSCGCKFVSSARTHGQSLTVTYRIWQGMWKRTTNPRCKDYEAYKDKTPPDSWRKYEQFLSDMGERPEGMTLERVRNSEPYGPNNCVWATYTEQMNNTRRSQRVEYRGKMYTVAQLSAISGKPYDALRYRLTQGWSAEDTVNVPYGGSPKVKAEQPVLVRLYSAGSKSIA